LCNTVVSVIFSSKLSIKAATLLEARFFFLDFGKTFVSLGLGVARSGVVGFLSSFDIAAALLDLSETNWVVFGFSKCCASSVGSEYA
jgi:hypothetical protein